MRRRRERGVALVTAVLVVALGAFLSTTVLRALLLDLRRTGQQVASEQAYQYARGLEAWGAAILAEDYRLSGAIDHGGEPWTKGVPFIDVPGGRLTGRLVDLDGRFNLNNLVVDGQRRERQVALFARLLALLGLDPAIAQAAVDWIDADAMASRRGAEDAAYLRRDPPYRTGNQPFIHVSELRSVAGVDGEAWRRLAPYVTALPTRGEPHRVNVNTAGAAVIAALDERIGVALAEELLGGSPRFETVEQFLRHPRLELLETDAIAGLLTVESRHFRAEGIVELAGERQRFHSLLLREGSAVRVLRRSRGAY